MRDTTDRELHVGQEVVFMYNESTLRQGWVDKLTPTGARVRFMSGLSERYLFRNKYKIYGL